MGSDSLVVAEETGHELSPATVAIIRLWPANVRRAFADYLALPVGNRSTRALAAYYETDASAPTTSHKTLQAWATRYGWVDAARDMLQARLTALQSESAERLAAMSDRAVDALGELLTAEKGVVLPTGAIAYVPDQPTRLKAAAELLSRAGIAPESRAVVTHQGPGGGPVQHAHLVADVSGLSQLELLEHLRDATRG